MAKKGRVGGNASCRYILNLVGRGGLTLLKSPFELGNAAWGASFPSKRALPAGGFGSVHHSRFPTSDMAAMWPCAGAAPASVEKSGSPWTFRTPSSDDVSFLFPHTWFFLPPFFVT